MDKIPTLLVRDPGDRRNVLMQVNPGCEWVLNGDGVPTRKYDGTCMRFDGQAWWARREVKPGKKAPEHFQAVVFDTVTGKTQGWVPASESSFSAMLAEAVAERGSWSAGTYELCGPKINGNPESMLRHRLVKHETADVADHEWDGSAHSIQDAVDLVLHVRDLGWEGIVWHHPDGRMVKLKGRDIRSARVPQDVVQDWVNDQEQPR